MLQEAEEQEAGESNNDSGVTAEANKINKDNDYMIISMEEEHKTLEYQEKMEVYVKNITKKKIYIPIYKVIHDPFLKKRIFLQMNF